MRIDNPPKFTLHFHEQMLKRYGMTLTAEEIDELGKCAFKTLRDYELADDEESLVLICDVYGKKFGAVYVPARNRVVTCINPNGGASIKKLRKKVFPTLNPTPGETRTEYIKRHKEVQHMFRRKKMRRHGGWRT